MKRIKLLPAICILATQASTIWAWECDNVGAATVLVPDDNGDDVTVVCGPLSTGTGAQASAYGYQSSSASAAAAFGGFATASAFSSTALGYSSDATAQGSTAVGRDAQASEEGAVAVGNGANAAGTQSVVIGTDASTTGEGSVVVGRLSGALALGDIAIGDEASATGSDSLAMAFASVASGIESIAIGVSSVASESGSLAIGAESFANADRSAAIGPNAQVDTMNAVVLGSIFGVNGATAYSNVGIGTTMPTNPLHVFRDDATQEFLYLDSNAAGGPQDRPMMYLANNGGIRFEFENRSLQTAWRFQAATGNQDRFEITKVGTGQLEMVLDGAGNMTIQGTFTEMSDRDAKQDVAELRGEEVLDRLSTVPVSEWSYKASPGQRHVGPMAQDFHAAFGLGQDERHISARDMAGVNMASIQALNEKLEVQNARLEVEVRSLKRELEDVKALLTGLLPRSASR